VIPSFPPRPFSPPLEHFPLVQSFQLSVYATFLTSSLPAASFAFLLFFLAIERLFFPFLFCLAHIFPPPFRRAFCIPRCFPSPALSSLSLPALLPPEIRAMKGHVIDRFIPFGTAPLKYSLHPLHDSLSAAKIAKVFVSDVTPFQDDHSAAGRLRHASSLLTAFCALFFVPFLSPLLSRICPLVLCHRPSLRLLESFLSRESSVSSLYPKYPSPSLFCRSGRSIAHSPLIYSSLIPLSLANTSSRPSLSLPGSTFFSPPAMDLSSLPLCAASFPFV